MSGKNRDILKDRLQLRANISFLLKSAIHKKSEEEGKRYGEIIEEILLKSPDMEQYISNIIDFYH